MNSTFVTPVLARPLHEDPRIHARRWFLLAMMCLSLVLVVMSVSGLVTAIPTMQEALSASASQVAWILDAYAIVFAGSLLTAGALGDRFGRKRALLTGLVVFGSGSLIAGMATSASQVIAGRAVMGIGAALVMPATLSIITTIFPPEERNRAIGVWAGFAGAGGAIGPIVSGALLERYWWGSAVLVNLPLVAATFIAIWTFAPESRDESRDAARPRRSSAVARRPRRARVHDHPRRRERLDDHTGHRRRRSSRSVALTGFLRWERRQNTRCCPSRLFRDRRFSVGSGVVTVAFFVMFGFFFLSTQYLQFGRGSTHRWRPASRCSRFRSSFVARVAPKRGVRRSVRRRTRDGNRTRGHRRRLPHPEPAHSGHALRRAGGRPSRSSARAWA